MTWRWGIGSTIENSSYLAQAVELEVTASTCFKLAITSLLLMLAILHE